MQSFAGVIVASNPSVESRGLRFRLLREGPFGTHREAWNRFSSAIDFLECNTAFIIHSQKIRLSQKN